MRRALFEPNSPDTTVVKLLNVLLLPAVGSATCDVWLHTVTQAIFLTAGSTRKKPMELLTGNQGFSPGTPLSCVIWSRSTQLALVSYKISGLVKKTEVFSNSKMQTVMTVSINHVSFDPDLVKCVVRTPWVKRHNTKHVSKIKHFFFPVIQWNGSYGSYFMYFF